MDKHLLTVLDYSKIKELLEKSIFTEPGKRYLKKIYPSSDFSVVQEWLRETSEMKDIIKQEGNLPLMPLSNIDSEIKKTRIQGSILTANIFLSIARVLECLNLVREFFNKLQDEEYPIIKGKVSQLKVFRLLEKEIKRCIDEEAEIVDEASPDLKKIRQRIRSTEKKIRDRLEQMIRDPQNRSFIQDDIVTIRQGRYVLPIKQQEKGKFPGIVHDKSESGVTIFIEPLPIVDLNNETRNLHQEEQKEEYRILQKLTALVGQNGVDILNSYQDLGYLDLIHAKALISIDMRAIEPDINNKGVIHLFKAKHPFLNNKPVPINIELGEKFDVLLITGPNTGGKTVTLKTVGLLQLMTQSGLHIPAGVDSEMAIYRNIFADIGDEQSMEQNLSTFSSHMKHIIHILESSDENTLVLLDELGAGTDPSEGSALSMAILDSLRQKGAKVLSTTHHDSIKAYAYLTERVMNARVEFDEITLQPTYEISIGLPGKSCAFSVAQRLGLSKKVINDARQYLKKEKLDLENLIRKMERDRDQMAKNIEYSEKEKKEIIELKRDLKLKMNAFEKEKEKVKLEAYREAEEILTSTQKRAKEIIRSLKKKNPEKKELFIEEENTFQSLQKEIRENIKKYGIKPKKESHLAEGDYVVIKSLNKPGMVIGENKKKKQYQIQLDHLKLTIPFTDVKKINKNEYEIKKNNVESAHISTYYSSHTDRLHKKAHFKHEINIRQMSAADAQIRLEKYLDDAFLLNISPVYIIHGK
ncbi:MAG: endonuclease MutS2, partial [Elusimicrobiota bacterium]